MNDEKQYTDGIDVKSSKFLSWLDNYWYHYKWVTIIVAFFLMVFLVCAIQMCSNNPSDIVITYAGSKYLKADENVRVQKALENSLPDGLFNKKEPDLGLNAYFVLTTNQIERLEGKGESVDRSFNTQEVDNLESYFMTGAGSVIFMDSEFYEYYFGSESGQARLMPLSEVFDKVPDAAIDDYAIRLGDTKLYQTEPGVTCLPEDTVILLHRKVIGQKNYEKEIEIFKSFAQDALVLEEIKLGQ